MSDVLRSEGRLKWIMQPNEFKHHQRDFKIATSKLIITVVPAVDIKQY